MSTDEVSRVQDAEKTSVLLARDHYDRFVVQYILLVYPGEADDSVAMRGTTLDLYVPMGQLDILEDLKPK